MRNNQLYDLDQARNKESYRKKLKYYARADLLIIDEWLLNTTTAQHQADILELLELLNITESRVHSIWKNKSI